MKSVFDQLNKIKKQEKKGDQPGLKKLSNI